MKTFLLCVTCAGIGALQPVVPARAQSLEQRYENENLQDQIWNDEAAAAQRQQELLYQQQEQQSDHTFRRQMEVPEGGPSPALPPVDN